MAIHELAQTLRDRLVHRASAVSRDVRMVLSVLSGAPPAPVVREGTAQRIVAVPSASTGVAAPSPSPPSPPSPPTGTQLGVGRRFQVSDVESCGPDAISIWLKPISGPCQPHTAGEFLTLAVPYRGDELRRAYSISSAPGDVRGYRIAVKRVDGGIVSNVLNDTLAAEDRFDVFGPSGTFTYNPSAEPLVLIAGGSGITPILSIIHAAIAGPAASVTLVYGNRGSQAVASRPSAGVMYDAELAALASRSSSRLQIIKAYDGDGQRLDRAGVDRALDEHAIALTDARCYLCGPAPMMAAAEAALLARGVAPGAIRRELFASPAGPLSTAALAQLTDEVVVIRGATGAPDATFQVPAGQTILAAAQRAGVALPFSCAMGGCGACAVTLTSGEVLLDEPHCLTPEERADKRVLTCVGRPLTGCQLELP